MATERTLAGVAVYGKETIHFQKHGTFVVPSCVVDSRHKLKLYE